MYEFVLNISKLLQFHRQTNRPSPRLLVWLSHPPSTSTLPPALLAPPPPASESPPAAAYAVALRPATARAPQHTKQENNQNNDNQLSFEHKRCENIRVGSV